MSMPSDRVRYLQQIPVFALKQMVNDSFPGPEGDEMLDARLRSALKRRPRLVRQALMRLTRQELTILIDACPEIGDEQIRTYFEQYRYGSHPSFYIYLFDPARLAPERLVDFDRCLAQALVDDNARFAADIERGLPPLCDVLLNDFDSLPEFPGLYEGTYRFLSRLDYIDAEENVISTYETLYGFFWISVVEGYATIHARKPEVLTSLRSAIEEAAGIVLTRLFISKEFKNALRFLDPDQFRSSRLYEPNPEARRYRWLTVADRRAYKKGYAALERNYPELRSTSYRVSVADKETTVRLTCHRGALSLSGRLQASQFRTWAVESLAEVIRVLKALSTEPAVYLQAYGLRDAPSLKAAYTGALQKDLVLELLSTVLSLKQAGQDAGMLSRSAAELAIAFPGDWGAQISCTCSEPGCEEESYVVCPVCEEAFFSLAERNGQYQLACLKKAQHWQASLPAEVTLDCGHSVLIDADRLRDDLELLSGARLLHTMVQLQPPHLIDYHFDPEKEGFYVRGSVLHYYADKDAWLEVLPKVGGKGIFVNNVTQNVQNLIGEMTGVSINT
ncbi:MAG: hypothetical protein JXM73_07070 [Anaerolineae bacterium]|nr:hypothetical protein [Anaerolineae bacterium]